MQSLNIKRPAEQASRIVASAILIGCPTVAATTTAIPSGYFIPTVLTNYRLYYLGSIPLLGLYCPTIPTNLFRSTVSTDCYRPTAATECSAIKGSATRCPTTY